MKKYVGTKQIEAEPMTMGEAYERGLLQAGKVPKEVEKSNAGYHVRYKDGYESWSPADPFEEAYRVAGTPLERMLIESEDLDSKTEKLRAFFYSDKFNTLDISMKALLVAQLKTMSDYQSLLNIRCAKMEIESKYGFHDFSFSIALHLLKAGYKVRREIWEEGYAVKMDSGTFFLNNKSGEYEFWRPVNADFLASDWEFIC